MTLKTKQIWLLSLITRFISTEGPHGGKRWAFNSKRFWEPINEAEIENQTDLSKYEEVGLYGFKQARENDPNIEEGARDVEENGVYVDEVYEKTTLWFSY